MHSAKKTPKVEKPAVKKKPGRPRKNPVREKGPINGIVNQPNNPNNQIEFVYDEPAIFKKIWNYAKCMAIESLQLIFRPSEVIIYGDDHTQKSRMRVRIDASKLNHYYCREPTECGIFNKNVEAIMMSIDETYNKISILIEIKDMRKHINLVLSNDIEIDENRRIELHASYPHLVDEMEFLDQDYTLRFELPGKYFKKMLSNMRLFSDQIAIRQDGPTEPLMFEYKNTVKKVFSKNIIRNSKKVKLQSTLTKDETFHSSFLIDYVKPIGLALASENITIWAHEKKPLTFIVILDNIVEVKIITSNKKEEAS